MLRKIFLWGIGRLAAKNERRIEAGQCAAHAMMLYVCGVPISTINASGNRIGDAPDLCLLRMPTSMDEMKRFLRCTTFAQAAERMMLETADELLLGRRLAKKRVPDKSLIGLCDGNGEILSTEADISARTEEVTTNIMAIKELPAEVTGSFRDLADYQAFYLGIHAKRVIAHYYMAIVHLGSALSKQPVVQGEQACRQLIEDCISRGPINSLPVYCACHTDPMRSAFDAQSSR